MKNVTLQGNPMTLEGDFPKLGTKLMDFSLLGSDLQLRKSSDYAGKILVILTVPSIDTKVCDMEVRKFNEEATKLSDNVRIVAVSTDLPFAQARWCAAANVKNVITLSDHMDAAFGKQFGVLIKELRVLARSVMVFDKQSNLVYSELLPEVSSEPNYDEALNAVKKLL